MNFLSPANQGRILGCAVAIAAVSAVLTVGWVSVQSLINFFSN